MGTGDPRLRADTDILTNPDMLYLSLGIIGATVMPHNLYLHSGIVQTRAFGDTAPEKREAVRYATIDSTMALMFALTINASILILAAATFHRTGNTGIQELDKVHALLSPLLGSALAPSLFAIALLCCGLNSTVTATMAGQIVMEGFLDLRLPPWLRRLITRLVAIVPAAAVTSSMGIAELRNCYPKPGGVEPAASLRDHPARHVHGHAKEDGATGRASMADSAGGRDRGDHHRAERQVAGRFRCELTGRRPADQAGPLNPAGFSATPEPRG